MLRMTPLRPFVSSFVAAASIGVCLAGMQSPQRLTAENSQSVTLEYQVKAAYLLNFTKFIDWPPEPPTAEGIRPFTLCIVGEDPFGPVIDQIVQGQKVGERPVVVQRVALNINKACQIVYIPSSEKAIKRLIEDLGAGVLTVGEGDGFIKEGGMIAFVLEDRRVKFDVNLRATRAAMLTLSSRLLAIAKWVGK